MGAIAERYAAVLRQVADAADIAGRDPADVTVVAVTKTVGVAEVASAIAASCHDFGENRSQEFHGKWCLFPGERWHFIGTLQTNKVADVVGKAHLIHSVDTLKLLRSVEFRAAAEDVTQDVLLQVNMAAEASKHGFEPGRVEDALEVSASLTHVNVRGLMTMAPLVARSEETRWVFRGLAELAERLRRVHHPGVELAELSMGMTNDFRVAVEEGATIVRVGRAIFGR